MRNEMYRAMIFMITQIKFVAKKCLNSKIVEKNKPNKSMLFSYAYAGKPSVGTMKWRYTSISSDRRHFSNGSCSKGGTPKGLWIALGSGFTSVAALLAYLYQRRRSQVWSLDTSIFLGTKQRRSTKLKEKEKLWFRRVGTAQQFHSHFLIGHTWVWVSSCVAEVFAIFGTTSRLSFISFISAGLVCWSLPVRKVLKPKSLRFSLQNTSLFKILSQFFEQQQFFLWNYCSKCTKYSVFHEQFFFLFYSKNGEN